MAGSFKQVDFRNIDVEDAFFDSLRSDYPGFVEWFQRKASGGAHALVVTSNAGIDAFLYLKDEANDAVQFFAGSLPPEPRLKIGTLKIAEHVQGTRLGEGALGLALWHWRDRGVRQVYTTVYPKHTALVDLLVKFGFQRAGERSDGELVMVKDRTALDCSSPYLSFPFIPGGFSEANMLPVEDHWHDKLFPYSELANTYSDDLNIAAGNGVSKIYLASPYSGDIAAMEGNPILIYRIHTGTGQKTYRSAVTSFGIVTGVHWVKRAGRTGASIGELNELVRNKSVFSPEEIEGWYAGRTNLVVLEVLYLGYFGPGNNVNHRTLSEAGLWKPVHPYAARYSAEEFAQVLQLGRFDVSGAIVD